MATRAYPLIRYEGKSPICARIADCLKQKFDLDQEFVTKMARNQPSTQLLIIDRRDDPITPLLNQWTYQAMIHELLGIRRNTVNLQESGELVLSSDDD